MDHDLFGVRRVQAGHIAIAWNNFDRSVPPKTAKGAYGSRLQPYREAKLVVTQQEENRSTLQALHLQSNAVKLKAVPSAKHEAGTQPKELA